MWTILVIVLLLNNFLASSVVDGQQISITRNNRQNDYDTELNYTTYYSTSSSSIAKYTSHEEQFEVSIIGEDNGISVYGEVAYLSDGQFRVDYNVLKAGMYQVHVETGGTDIYCGLGEEYKCSPFALTVLPGATLASTSEVESSFNPVDNLVEARAGEVGNIFLQAKDAFGNNRISGDDDVIVKFRNTANSDIQYRGNVLDNNDGSYGISYSIPLAGSYQVLITVGGEPVKLCVNPSGEDRWDTRQYDGVSVYSSPSYCSLDDVVNLNVIHRELHGVSSTLVEDEDEGLLRGLSSAVVGVETGFTIEARDKFGNLRTGSSTSNIDESGDGMSDAFLVSLVGPSGHTTLTSTAVQVLTSSDSAVSGHFRFSYGGKVSEDIPHDFSGPAMQVVLSSMHDNNDFSSTSSSVQVTRSTNVNGNYEWRITFLNHLDLWSQYPLSILPGSDGFSAVADSMSVTKQSSAGLYPVRYTLWERGIYELSVISGTTLVSDSTYMVDVANGVPQASSSSAFGAGIDDVGVAGEESSFEVHVRDKRQSEIQSIVTYATTIDYINEVQQLQVLSNVGETFQIEFRGYQTDDIEVGVSTLEDMANALEALPTIGQVSVSSSDESFVVSNGDSIINIEFVTEHGSLDLMTSSGPEVISKLVEGEAPRRAERLVISCNADGGYIILSFEKSTATIEFDDTLSIVSSKLSTLYGSTVTIIEPDNDSSITTICNSGAGKTVFVDFPLQLGDVESTNISYNALESGSMSIFSNGQGHYGAVDGISPIMGSFTLAHEGETTSAISVTASAEEVESELEVLPSIGSVDVTKDTFGIRQEFSIWSITFGDGKETGCEPGNWDNCPAMIGDISPLVVDSSLITYDIGATQQQSAPTVEVYEVIKGSSGNLLDDDAIDQSTIDIDFNLSHNLVGGVGIANNEVHTISCTYSPEALANADASGSFDLEILNKHVTIDAHTTVDELKLLLSNTLGLSYAAIDSSGSSHGSVCHFDPFNPITAVTKLMFAKKDGPIPNFYVNLQQSVLVSASNLVDAVDKIEYLGSGRYLVTYTPTISGHYSASIKLNNEYLWTDLSAGVVINPAAASAQHSTHNANLVAVAGTEESFALVARDRFGNELSSVVSSLDSLVIDINGTSDSCNMERHDLPEATVEELEIGSPDGHYKMTYTPNISGKYQSSIMLRSHGGLLATYFKNEDFSQPVYGNNNHYSSPYHETPWCGGGGVGGPVCDSTRLDEEIYFDWGLQSPLPSDPSFPMESFSIIWIGEVKVDVSDEYRFTVNLNGGVRLTIGEHVAIDNLDDTSSFSVSSSTPVMLDQDVFYPIKIEYVHSSEEAKVQLVWESSTITTKEVVPSSVFYYTRHIGGSTTPSPISINVAPSSIATTSTAEGDGLVDCVALEECSFVIQTKDANLNNRYNDGSDPGFEITIQGTDGWAEVGMINSVAPSPPSPIDVSAITITNHDWDYIGEADVVHLSNQVTSKTSFVGILFRGDSIVIDGSIYTISSTSTFDATTVPLSSPYLGASNSSASVYKTSETCSTGTHTIKYTPTVRGSYQMDAKLPIVKEVQRVTTSARSHSSLSGAFTLAYHGGEPGTDPLVSGSIDFDSNTEAFRMALESIETIGSASVSLHECDDPTISCSWDVTFLSLEGDVNMLVPNTIQLGGDMSEIQVDELVKGRRAKSIIGFPTTITVLPGETSPSRTTAYDRGLVLATVGETATFHIQPKDAFGNDRLAEQGSDLFAVYIYPEQELPNGSVPVMKGHVQRESGGYYSVSYTPTISGEHTIAVVQAVQTEQQIITTRYNTKARGGSFSIKLGNLSTPPIPWDADGKTIKNILDSSMRTVSSFHVDKQQEGLFNFKYVITFETLLGEAPDFVLDTLNLIGNVNVWDVSMTMQGEFKHIKLSDQPTHEVQSINLQVLDDSSTTGATFELTFKGQHTEPITWDADEYDLQQQLEALSTVGDIMVTLNVDGSTNERTWLVTFDPHEGKSSNSLSNFGDLPLIGMSNVDDGISITVESVSDGASPFKVLVSPAQPSSANTMAYDHEGVLHYEGLSTGVYKSNTHFYIQSRDEYSNEIQDGPLSEIQIIETSSSTTIGGYFEVTMFDTTVRFSANASPMELEKSLQSMPGIGLVSVSSKSAKDLVVGKTVDITKGLDTMTPSHELIEFAIGDWIRIGDQDEGQLFSIVDMADNSPYTVTISQPYLDESDDAANIYQHGTTGYQYIVHFDAILFDLPELSVDGTLLEGDDATIEVTSCDWNVHQSLVAHAMDPSSPISGHFYLVYGDEQTRLLSVDVTAEELEDAILSDITSLHDIKVSSIVSHSWHLHLTYYENDPLLFFAERHLITNGHIAAVSICPVASSDEPLYSVESQAGRRGEDYLVMLEGASTVHGTVAHVEDGRYMATYTAPRVGDYNLTIQVAHAGGLTGEYYNNRWLYGTPASIQLDQEIEFTWDSDDAVSDTSKDFVSIRWYGYIKPAFDEVYTFTAHVNDALKLWVGNELLIDEYENEVDDNSDGEYVVFSATSNEALTAGQLVPIKIEYRENRGSAMLHLFWQSISQPFAIIDQPRMYYNATHIHGSPFEVTPVAIEPTEPTHCSVDIADWKSLHLTWSAPKDDGGSNITNYLVEWWDASLDDITISSHEITVDDGTSTEYTITDLLQPSGVTEGYGVQVSAANVIEYGTICPPIYRKPYGVPQPPRNVEIKRVASNPSSLGLHFTSVTSPDDRSAIVDTYVVELSTQDNFGTIVKNETLDAGSISSYRLDSYNGVDKAWYYYLVEDLTPGIEYFVRVAAVNKAGAGPFSRSSPLSLQPGHKPTDVEDVTLSTISADDFVSVMESSSSLRLAWRAPHDNNGFATNKFLIETWLTDGVNEIQQIELQSPTGSSAQGTFTLGYGDDKTDSLSIDSTAEDVQSALESLSAIRAVRVWRSGVNPDYVWKVTFTSDYPSISGRVIEIDDTTELSDDVGGFPTMEISVLTPSSLPIGYTTEVITVEDPLKTYYEHILTDLTAGQSYNVQVSAANELGYGNPQTSIPHQLVPPVQKPSSPTNVILSVASSESLEVAFTKPESDGGDTISKYRIEWDTSHEYDSLGDGGSYSFVSNGECDPCSHQITGLAKGQEYYVRVYAYNSHGYSVEPGYPDPLALAPKTAPEPPEEVNILPNGDTTIQVTFPHSPDDGGSPVTKYKVEWNAMGYSSSYRKLGLSSMNGDDHTAFLYSPYNVHSITVSADEDDLGGVFRVAFDGHSTDDISVKATANDMKLALESLPTLGSIVVSRDTTSSGYTWAITFLTNRANIGDKYGPIDSLRVSTDPSALASTFVTDTALESLGTNARSLYGTNARLVITEEVTAYMGYEQQTLTTQCDTPTGIMSGRFALSVDGVMTNDISFDVSPSDLKTDLEPILSIGTVQVNRRIIHDSINSFEWTIIFLDRLGNVPLISVHDDELACSDGSAGPLMYSIETVQGVLPTMDGPFAGEIDLNAQDYVDETDIVFSVGNLVRGMPYHFQVSAWNEVGGGESQYSSPSIMIPMDKPDTPTSVDIKSIDDKTLQIGWDFGSLSGSQNIQQFRVELIDDDHNTDSFHVDPTPEVQEIIFESTAEDMGGYITIQFMGETSISINADANSDDIGSALMGMTTIDVVDVSIDDISSHMSSFGFRWTISFTTEKGNLPSLLVSTGSGPPSTIATGGTLTGSSSVVRVETITDGGMSKSFITPSSLSPEKTYTSRVYSFNGYSWSDPANSLPKKPTKTVSSSPRDVRVNALSDTELGVSWTEPLFTGGDLLSNYRLEWDTDALFDHSSQLVSPAGEHNYFVIKNLDPSEAYFVRIMAYNSLGFSDPQMASPLLSNTQMFDISLADATGTLDYSESFVIGYSTSNGFYRQTLPISVLATTQEVENELNSLGQVGVVSVDREDHSSSGYDTSGIETSFFSMLYRLTFIGVDDNVTLSVDNNNLGSVEVTIEGQ